MGAGILALACGPLIFPIAFLYFVALAWPPNEMLGYAVISIPAIPGLVMIAVVWAVRGGPLHHCARTRQTEHITRMIASGDNVNARTFLGATPLHFAAARGDRACVEKFLEHGANPALRDRDGRTPSDWAQARGHAEIADRLHSAA